jgi:hypothetical protein
LYEKSFIESRFYELTMGTKSKSFSLVFVVLFLATLVTVPSTLPAQAALSWNVQQVNEYVWSGGDCPIIVDHNNTSHIAYLDGYTLIYANYNGSVWTNQSIATDGIYVIFSLVLDANGYPHILYERALEGPLVIASWNGKSWDHQNIEIVYLDPATHFGISGTNYAALALDFFGNPSIVYTTFTTVINNPHDWAKNTANTSLKYARWTGTSWNTQTVDTVVNDSLSSISFVFGKNNQPYILYSPSSNSSNIKLAIYQNSNWKIQTAQLPPSTGNCGNIVMDSKGNPHFLSKQPYQNSTTLSNILYVSFNQTTWNTQLIASKVSLGYDSSIGELVLDSNDYPHFTYGTSDDKTMYLAYSGNIWENQTLASNISVGDLALDSSDNPHLLFRTYSPARYESHLMYANATEATLSPTTSMLNANVAQILLIITSVTVSVVVIVSLLLYRKHRKTISQNKPNV